MPNPNFPHLQLLVRKRGEAILEGGGTADPRITANKGNRAGHSGNLIAKVSTFSGLAKKIQLERASAGLPAIHSGAAFLLQIPDEDDGAIEFLAEKLGLEIVAEYDDGFLIVATDDLELQRVIDLASEFVKGHRGSGTMANILEIDDDPLSPNRINRILDEDLQARWPFPDDQELILDVSIEVAAFGQPAKPRVSSRTKAETKALKTSEFQNNKEEFVRKWDQKRIEREEEIERFVQHYHGEICHITDDSNIVEFPDCFSARIRMSGAGFKDLIQNYPNVFEVTVPEEIDQPHFGDAIEAGSEPAFRLEQPDEESAAICVIDSGIQENHRWLQASIDSEVSKCFIPGTAPNDVADYVENGGHGTRVAGACLFPVNIPIAGFQKAPFWLQNARVLDRNNWLPVSIFPAELLRAVVSHFKTRRGTRIYQHSIAGNRCCRVSRMSVWAAMIDLLSYREDVLFIQAAGNLNRQGYATRPGILDHIQQGRRYPDFLHEASSRLANPAQSLQALTVGSISGEAFVDGNRRSVTAASSPSPFSRSGFGMWDSVKPEVVEFGGDYAINDSSPQNLTSPPQVCPELVRSTLHGGPPYARDTVGTSFAAPKVAHIAGHLASQFPSQGSLLYRALIVNSARWPAWAEIANVSQRPDIMRSLGYGIPDLSRATENTQHRVTLITERTYEVRAKEGFIFGIPIPEALRRPEENHRIRIEITLSYSAEPRRTRKSRRGYLGVWLDWKASKRRESFKTFVARALKDSPTGDGVNDGNFSWTLGNKSERDGETDGVSRRNGTVQKDWAIANSFELPDVFGIVVRGHEGWDRKNPSATARFCLAITLEVLGSTIRIYEPVQVAIAQEIEAEAPRVGVEV